MTTALLLSGGIDSIAIAYWRRPSLAITVDYGQQAANAEIAASRSVCRALGLEHIVLTANCASLGSGDMAQSPPAPIAPVPEWWPFRNQYLLTVAGMYATPRGFRELLIGSLATDGSHADGTVEFVRSISDLMASQEGGITVSAPGIHLTSHELVIQSGVTREILAWAHSCHVSNFACGQCRGCLKHYATLLDLGHEPY